MELSGAAGTIGFMSAAPVAKLSFEQYLAMDRASDCRLFSETACRQSLPSLFGAARANQPDPLCVPPTAAYDYGGKFELYRSLLSLEEYVLIAQHRPRIETYRKTPDGRWLLSTFEELGATVKLESLEMSIPLAEVYHRVEFRTEPMASL